MAARGSEAGGDTELRRTPLHGLHRELGARFVPFAGYEMPVQYPTGVLREHRHTREAASLFDVSHMGQAFVIGPDHGAAAAALEALVPGDVARLGRGRVRYTVLLNDAGGIIDDIMVTRSASEVDDGALLLVLNAARREVDLPHIARALPGGVTVAPARARALIALQGPRAADVLARHCGDLSDLGFMSAGSAVIAGADCHLSRSGYTGEDGFEISVDAGRAEAVARVLLGEDEVAPAGLGARDTLRLEAGLCLYGNDIDETTSPVEAGLGWVVARRRRAEGGFPGAGRILAELDRGPARLRVGLLPEGRAPARAGAAIMLGGREIGTVTSGGYGPTLNAPVAMGYVESRAAAAGTCVEIVAGGRSREARVVELPLVAHRYHLQKS
jgi:aminomethyltransferase